jgi:hypothetical protein
MNVNEKGNIGLIEVIRDLTKKGYECFTPLHDYSAVDLIVMDKNYNVKKLQVKYRQVDSRINSVEIPFSTVVNGKKIPIDLSAIDGWAVYIPDVDSVCYFNKEQIRNVKNFRIRKEVGKNTINVDKSRAPLYSELLDESIIW